MKTKKLKKKVKKSFKENGIVCSDEEMMDLTKDLYPLSHYVDDEEELVGQLFATIKQTRLQSMLPPVLKEVDLIELQNLCLHELRGMSRKRIIAAINGQQMTSSSSDEFENESSKRPSLPKVGDIPMPPKKEDQVVDKEHTSQKIKEISPERFKPIKSVTPPPPVQDLTPPKKSIEDAENGANLTALDLLELEMRAKLIKTMLDKQPSDEENGSLKMTEFINDLPDELIPPDQIKQEPPSPEIIIKKEISPNYQEDYSPKRTPKEKSKHGRSYSKSSSDNSYSRSRSRSRSISRSRSRSKSRRRSRSVSTSSFSSDSSDSSTRKSSDVGKYGKKKKLSRREFRERMKKAKLNRTYRKRRDSVSESEDSSSPSRSKKKKKKKTNYKEHPKASWEIEYFEKLKQELKHTEPEKENASSLPEKVIENDDDAEEGEYFSKEEGELESEENEPREQIEEEEPPVPEEEEEEGACTPSDEEKEIKSNDPPAIPITCLPNPNAVGSSDDSGDKSHSRRHKRKKKRKKTSSHRGRSKSPVLPKIRQNKRSSRKHKTTEVLKTVSSVINEPEIPLENEAQYSLKHAEMIDSDENFEETFKGSSGVASLPSKSERQWISFSLTKKTAPVKRNQEPCTESVVEESSVEAHKPIVEESLITQHSESSQRLSHTMVDEPTEIRHVIPLLNPSTTVPSGQEDLNLLFTDWEELPTGEGLATSESVIQSHVNDHLNSHEGDLHIENTKDVVSGGNAQIEAVSNIDDESNSKLDRISPIAESDSLDKSTEVTSKTEAEMEIIGVIEPHVDSNSDSFDEGMFGESSWSSRWLQSEKVQNVISNSKILSKMRQKIKIKGKDKPKFVTKEESTHSKEVIPPKPDKTIVEEPVVVAVQQPEPKKSSVIGSIEEYEKLIGLKVSGFVDASKTSKVSTISALDSDDDEDSEEEALWSKIMKK